MEGDFLSGLPGWVGSGALGVQGAVLAAWTGFQALRALRGEGLQMGKVLLVLATAPADADAPTCDADDPAPLDPAAVLADPGLLPPARAEALVAFGAWAWARVLERTWGE